MSETVILIRCHAPAIRPRRTTTAGASVLVRVSCADISLSHLLVPGRGSPALWNKVRPPSPVRGRGGNTSLAGRPRRGVESPTPSDQAGAERQPGEVGAAPASGLVPDPVQVRADRAHADVHLRRDLRIGAPPRDQRDKLPFPRAELHKTRVPGRRGNAPRARTRGGAARGGAARGGAPRGDASRGSAGRGHR